MDGIWMGNQGGGEAEGAGADSNEGEAGIKEAKRVESWRNWWNFLENYEENFWVWGKLFGRFFKGV